jgi:hypothetical protein
MLEIKLNNIYLNMVKNHVLTEQILSELINNSPFLMKLTLSNINLRNDKIIKNFQILLQNKKHLQYLDLTNSFLDSNDLNIISLELIKNTTIRDLNLSYNCLKYQTDE